MKEEKDIQKELREMGPLLGKLKEKDEGFRVPENYFKSLPDEILGQIKKPAVDVKATQVNQSGILSDLRLKLRFLLQPRYVMMISSMIILIILAVIFLRPAPEISDDFFSDISNTELDDYILSNIDDFDFNTIVEAGLDEVNLDFEKENLQNEIDGFIDELMEDVEISDLEDLL